MEVSLKKKKYKRHPLAYTWYAMKQRCLNPKNPSYKNYGGRGVTICDKWRLSFKHFVNDIGVRPSPFHQLDRIDNNGNYCVENVKWSSKREQAHNRRNNVKHIGVYKHSQVDAYKVYKNGVYVGLFYNYNEAVLATK